MSYGCNWGTILGIIKEIEKIKFHSSYQFDTLAVFIQLSGFISL